MTWFIAASAGFVFLWLALGMVVYLVSRKVVRDVWGVDSEDIDEV